MGQSAEICMFSDNMMSMWIISSAWFLANNFQKFCQVFVSISWSFNILQIGNVGDLKSKFLRCTKILWAKLF